MQGLGDSKVKLRYKLVNFNDMKKTAIIILTIAILGSLSLYARGHSSSVSAAFGKSATGAGSNISSSTSQQVSYKNGTFGGSTSQTPYGPVQVAAVINGGKITDVQFWQMPSDMQHSQEVTAIAGPMLKQETLSAQSAHIDFISGATSTSYGYQQSLQSALDKAAVASSGSNSGSSNTTTSPAANNTNSQTIYAPNSSNNGLDQ